MKKETILKPEDFADNLVVHLNGSRTKNGTAPVSFPLEVFPKEIQNFALELSKAYGIPAEYYAGAILIASSALIGNGFELQYKLGYKVKAILWGAIIGPSSIGKTPMLNAVLWPFREIEKKYSEEYEENKVEYQQLTEDLKKQEAPPVRKEILINDTTAEGLIRPLKVNSWGLLQTVDELSTFLRGMNRYNSGNDEQFFMSLWSGTFAKFNRATKETETINNPFLSILGGIQPKILKDLGKKDRLNNGFAYRLLFVWPENLKKAKDTDVQPAPEVFPAYRDFIQKLLSLSEGEPFKLVEMDKEAQLTYRKWYNQLTDRINETDFEPEQSLLGKIQEYCLRFALILEILHIASNDQIFCAIELSESGKANFSVTQTTVERAIKLANYFSHTGDKVLSQILGTEPLKTLSAIQLQVYEMLDPQFSTGEGIKLAAKVGMKEKTFRRFLTSSEVFRKVKHGFWEKYE